MEQKPKKREWVKNAAIIFLAVMLVLTFFSNTIMNRTLPEVVTRYVEPGSIDAKVRIKGTVAAQESYEVIIDQTHTVASVAVKVGQPVSTGDLLFTLEAGDSDELDRQKLLLLCFTVLSSLETQCPAVCTVKIAKAAFFDALRAIDADLPDRSTDTGAFSFYYLSYRRGTEVDRRIGQTFAMLCAHDGDPIYQELGEAIYCWFYSVVNKKIKQAAFAVS